MRHHRRLTVALGGARFNAWNANHRLRKEGGFTMDADSLEAIELCRRVITCPVHQRNPRWGEDFIAHRIAEHPDIAPEVRRIRHESESQLPHV